MLCGLLEQAQAQVQAQAHDITYGLVAMAQTWTRFMGHGAISQMLLALFYSALLSSCAPICILVFSFYNVTTSRPSYNTVHTTYSYNIRVLISPRPALSICPPSKTHQGPDGSFHQLSNSPEAAP